MERASNEELAYIRYSAKELLFHQAQLLTTLQADITGLKLSMTEMVTRAELSTARRWAITATIGAASALAGVARLMGI